MEIKTFIYERKQKNTHVNTWIPGHSEIEDNDKADLLADLGSNLNIPLDVKINIETTIFNIKIKNNFVKEWKSISNNKGKTII